MKAVSFLFLLSLLGLTGCASPASGIAGTPRALPSFTPACPDAQTVMESFYAATGQDDVQTALDLFTPQATLLTWAEGINGHHMDAHDYQGREAIAPALANVGLRLTSGKPSAPLYHPEGWKVSGATLTFYLYPDRKHPDGRPYNPYQVTAVFAGCKISALTVIERVTWV